MSYKSKLSGGYVSVGPFLEAEKAVSEFIENLYFIILMNESMKERNQIQKIYDEAVRENDREAEGTAKRQLQAADNMLSLALSSIKYDEASEV